MVYPGQLEGKLVLLKSIDVEDAEFSYNLRQDNRKARFVHNISGGVEQQREWIEKQRQRKGDYFFVACRKNGERIGTYGVYDISEKTADVGRFFSVGNQIEFTESTLLVHDFAFEVLHLESVYSDILAENLPALGGNKRVGGVEESRHYDEEFKMDMIHAVIYKEAYFRERQKLVRLIERFAERTKWRE